MYNLSVNNLMLSNIKQWDVQVLYALSDPIVVKDILTVPLVEEVIEDSMI